MVTTVSFRSALGLIKKDTLDYSTGDSNTPDEPEHDHRKGPYGASNIDDHYTDVSFWDR